MVFAVFLSLRERENAPVNIKDKVINALTVIKT